MTKMLDNIELPDTDASHYLKVKAGSDLSADRTLTLTTGDADLDVDLAALTTATSTLTDNAIVRGDGGARGVQTSTAEIHDDGSVHFTMTDSTTNSSSVVFSAIHRSTGTVSTGFGSQWGFTLQSASGASRGAAIWEVVWVTATDASRKARFSHAVYDTAPRTYLIGEASGLAPMIGFLGASAALQQTGDAGTALVTFGLMSGTPTFAATNLSGLGSGVATFLATPSSANLAACVTGETGSGALVFATSPTLVTPLLGTPASGTLTNCTGYAAKNLSGTQVNAYLSSDQAISADTWTTVQLDTETLDSGSEFATGTYTFTPAETGTYLVDFRVTIGSGPARIIAAIWEGTSSEVKRLADGTLIMAGNCALVSLTASTGYTFRVFLVGGTGTASGGAASTNLVIRRLY